jgi:MFS transporter, DHA3 family, macrolide efflux protein
MNSPPRPTGMRAFTIVWFGQLVSLTGTAMTQFAIALWAWEITGQATALALVGFFAFAPTILFSPIAGALVDRWDRKLVMMISDLAAGFSTIILLLLFLSDNLQIWHLYIAGAFTGVFQAFQFPAYSAAISTMIPKEQYARADAMMGLAEAASGIFAPILAGAVYSIIRLGGIMAIDILTFLIAITTLLLVHIPRPQVSETGKAAQGNLWQESIYGFRYIFARPSLLGLQLVFFCGNFLTSVAFVLLTPMLLARTGNNELAVGGIQSAFGIGGVVGGLALSAWGGPKRKVHGVLLGWTFLGIGTALFGLGQIVPIWFALAFITTLFNPLINASNQAIWQAKIAPDIQGRVFSTRAMIAQVTGPLGMLIAGPLADKVFGPAMMSGGAWAGSLGWLVGVGPGAGMALIFVICGVLTVLIGLYPYSVRAIREAEIILPDHDTEPAAQ